MTKIEKLEFPNGDVYEGEVKDEKMHGKGILTLSNGNEYEGKFKDNIIQDGTTLTFEDIHYYIKGKSKYIGQYNKEGLPDGYGTFTHHNGNIYEGEVKEEKYHGQGTFIDVDGNKYVGEFKNYEYHGQGL